MRIRPILTVLAALLAAGCDESPTESLPRETAFTFEYRIGADASWRAFESTGLHPWAETMEGEGVHAAVSSVGRRYAHLHVRQQTAPASWISFSALVPLMAEGDTVHIIAIGELCTSGRYCVNAGFTLIPAGAAAEHCAFTSGSYLLTRVTGEWLSATFSGAGTCGRDAAQRPFQVRAGSLDVLLRDLPGNIPASRSGQ